MLTKRVDKRRFQKKKKQFVAKPKPFVGLTDTMAVLYPRSAVEYKELENGPQAFLESCHKKLTQLFGKNGSFIKGQAYRVFTQPVPPTIAWNRNGANIEWDRHSARMKEYDSNISKFEEDKPKMFSVIMGNLSPASELLVKQDQDWETNNLEVTQDPLLLVKIIIKSHLSENTGSTILDQKAAHRAYSLFKQHDNEKLSDYRRRLISCVERLNAIGCAFMPSEEDQVATFAAGLTGQYAAYSTEFSNLMVRKSTTLPKTLAEVERAATYFRPNSDADVGKRGRSDPGASFVTTEEVAAVVKHALDNVQSSTKKPQNTALHANGKGQGKTPFGGKGGNKNQGKGKGGGRPNNHKRFGDNDEVVEDEDPTPAKRQKADSTTTCYVCKEPGHFGKDCPLLSKIHELVDEGSLTKYGLKRTYITYHLPIALTAKADVLGPYDVLLDSQSNTNAFQNKDLLTKLRRVPDFSLGGMAEGRSIISNQVGKVKGIDFGDVYLFPNAAANVLSQDKVADMGYPISYEQEQRRFIVTIPGHGDLIFERRLGGLHVCDFSFLLDHHQCRHGNDERRRKSNLTLFNTIAEREREFSKRDVILSRRARRLLRCMGYTPPALVGQMLNGGVVTNCDLTSTNVVTASKIYGKLVPELRGKSVQQKGADILTVEPGQDVGRLSLTMHTDVIYIMRWAVLLSVFDPINLTISRCIDTSKRDSNKPTSRDLRLALDETLNEVLARPTLEVTECHADGEFCNNEVMAPLVNRNVKVTICPPGSHVARVERKARVVKERVRCHLSNLPYLLPSILLPWLIAFVMFCLNIIPVRCGGHYISPREIMTGRKLNAQRDLRHEFGEYAEAKNPHAHSNLVTDARTDACILLLNTGNVQGDVHCYKLDNGEFVRRSHWTALDMPDTVINRLNALARAEPASHRLNPAPEFYIGDGTVRLGGELDYDDDIEHYDGPGRTQVDTPTTAPTDVPTLEYTLADNRISDSDGDVIMDLADTNTPDGGNAVNYTLGSPRASGAGDNFAFMVHVRKVLFLGGKCFRMSIRAAEKQHGIDLTAETLRKELAQMLKKKVWCPLNWHCLTSAEKRSVIRSCIFLKEKYDANGLFQKLKARLVAGGDKQDRTIYAESEISSPTVSTSAVLMVATIAAKERRKVVTLDYSGAYLNARLKRPVRMLLEPKLAEVLCEMMPSYRKFLRVDGSLCVGLEKALYGCIESAKLWYDTISSHLRALGFVSNDYDPCVFNKYVHGSQVTITLYVDDLMVTCANNRALDAVVQQLEDMFEGTTVHRGTAHSYIGMLFDFGTPGKVLVKMDGYIDDFLDEYQVKGSAPTPSTNDLFVVDPNAELLDGASKDIFHSRVAKVLYCAKRSRPDLLTTTSFLATRVQQPTVQDFGKLGRLLKYVNGTRDLWLTLEAEEGWGLFAYIDASYGVHQDGKSHTGVCMLLGKGAFYVQSSKQKIVSKSSTEAEIVAVSDGLSEVIWARNFLLDQGVQLGPAVVYQDNKSTMALISKGRSTSSRTKHINIRYFFVKDRVEAGEIVIKYAPTEEMLADILTKPLQGELFRKLRHALLNLRKRKAGGE